MTIKHITLALIFSLLALLVQAQNVSININAEQDYTPLNTNGTILMTICNTGPANVILPSNRIRPLVTVGAAASITNVTNPDGSPLSTFSFTINDPGTPANGVRLINNSTITRSQCLSAQIHYLAVNSATSDLVSGTVGFVGAQTSGNDISDDNSFTTINVGSSTPVSLATFVSKADGKNARLSWSTAQEVHNSLFEIQHSTNGKDFETIGTLEGKGTTTVKQEYNFTHYDLDPSVIHYYRLKQIDFDGNYTFSRSVSVKFDAYLGIQLRVSSTPTRNIQAWVHYGDTNLANASEIQLIDYLGRKIMSKRIRLVPGENKITFEGNLLTTGIYIVSLISQNSVVSGKVILN
ncbi:T9SS type A sorting domain-containing protein [Siphonobacter sp. SORGH_AS_0500]|uniref:T9SS type A sorting domain-containing protein n=1 Tax=Siphonobacter sp. SORGH_AS_0500 TaxID=1864824 RepID=UPI00285725F8|nr:T9SS type A sorting domain-containing protein [Siphonobacter sp. SORGH_AS_0500]MDR6197294.1 hypothetical protein [Siphonobacter sp. SORGH_AS_0500]